MSIHHGKFNVNDLEPLKGEHVVLASGGPLMRVECIEGDNVICAWDDFPIVDGRVRRETQRKAFDWRSVRKLSKVSREELGRMAEENASDGK